MTAPFSKGRSLSLSVVALEKELIAARQNRGMYSNKLREFELLCGLAEAHSGSRPATPAAVGELLAKAAQTAVLPPNGPSVECWPRFPLGIAVLWHLGQQGRRPGLSERQQATAKALVTERSTFGRTQKVMTRSLAIELMKLARELNLIEDPDESTPGPPTTSAGLESAQRHGRYLFAEFAASAGLTLSLEVSSSLTAPQQSVITNRKRDRLEAAVQPLFHPWEYGQLRNFKAQDGVLGSQVIDEAGEFTVPSFDYWRWFPDGAHYGLVSLREDEHDQTRHMLDWEMRALRAAEALLYVVRMYEGLGVDPAAVVKVTTRYGGLRGWKMGGDHVIGNRVCTDDEVSAEVVAALGALRADFEHYARLLLDPFFHAFRGFAPPAPRLRSRLTDVLNGEFS